MKSSQLVLKNCGLLLLVFNLHIWTANAELRIGLYVPQGIMSIPLGARSVAMGESYTSVAEGVSCIYWNPAGMAFEPLSQMSFGLVSPIYEKLVWVPNDNRAGKYRGLKTSTPYLTTFGVTNRINNSISAGGSVIFLGYYDSPSADRYVNEIVEREIVTTGAISYIPIKYTKSFATGIAFKLHHRTTAETWNSTLAFDFGLLYKIDLSEGNNLQWGACLTNIGTQIYSNKRDIESILPSEFRTGFALMHNNLKTPTEIINNWNIVIPIEVVRELYQEGYGNLAYLQGKSIWEVLPETQFADLELHSGIEIEMDSTLAIRFGYGLSENRHEYRTGQFSWGIGLHIWLFELDFARRARSRGSSDVEYRFQVSMKLD